ncbi:3-keto-disaccharide hydrolase [Segetibacter koreensis]|uniref:3-keto-disaccharide hydrolase n=1 Tax=Segetibacter koreensis TaxID=398037 RepID=UPI0003658CCB|nr:DUF1080 domain-containing protein [Segetibacter koreensis]
MKFLQPVFLLFLFFISVVSFSTIRRNDDWTSLFNGRDLTGWNTYLGPDLDSTGKIIGKTPVGLDNDPKHVFTIVKEDGENIIRISGESWGAISTKNEYENYHFQLKFKWGNLTWGQKKNKKKDSGLLYHSVGRYGADYGAWMRSQEFQIEEGNCGEYWGVAGGIADIPAIQNSDSDYVYNPNGKMFTFSADGPVGRHCRKAIDAEKPSGQWNTLDLYSHGDTSVHMINGKVMMVLYNSRQMENGKTLPLAKGKLQIQSEGAEVFYKEIKIQPLSQLPAEFFK